MDDVLRIGDFVQRDRTSITGQIVAFHTSNGQDYVELETDDRGRRRYDIRDVSHIIPVPDVTDLPAIEKWLEAP